MEKGELHVHGGRAEQVQLRRGAESFEFLALGAVARRLAHLAFGRICVCAGVMGLLLWFCRAYFHFSPWILVLIALLALIIYAGALSALRVIKIEQFKDAFRRFR